MANKVKIKDEQGNQVFPITHVSAVLNDNGDNIGEIVSGKQDELVSGSNIKTVNGQSLLGSGNISIQGGSGGGGDANVIESITFNGNDVPVDGNKNAAISYTAPVTSVNGNTGAVVLDLISLESTDSTAYSPDFNPESDTVHVTQQTLSTAQKTQARSNIGAADASTAVNSIAIRNIVTISQTDYDALSSKDNTTLYIIS